MVIFKDSNGDCLQTKGLVHLEGEKEEESFTHFPVENGLVKASAHLEGFWQTTRSLETVAHATFSNALITETANFTGKSEKEWNASTDSSSHTSTPHGGKGEVNEDEQFEHPFLQSSSNTKFQPFDCEATHTCTSSGSLYGRCVGESSTCEIISNSSDYLYESSSFSVSEERGRTGDASTLFVTPLFNRDLDGLSTLRAVREFILEASADNEDTPTEVIATNTLASLYNLPSNSPLSNGSPTALASSKEPAIEHTAMFDHPVTRSCYDATAASSYNCDPRAATAQGGHVEDVKVLNRDGLQHTAIKDKDDWHAPDKATDATVSALYVSNNAFHSSKNHHPPAQPPVTKSTRRKGNRKRSKPEDGSNERFVYSKSADKYIEEWARRLGVRLYRDFTYACLDPRYMNAHRSLKLSADRLSVVGTRGWSSILCSMCADYGSWYFEATLNNPDKSWEEIKLFGWEGSKTIKDMIQVSPFVRESYSPSVRVGWGTRLMKLAAPVGANAFGYSIIQRNGYASHNGRFSVVGGHGKTLPVNSVIGCYIHIPFHPNHSVLADPRMEESLWSFLKEGLLCNTTSDATLPPRIPVYGSFIEFSVNGQLLGKAFCDIYSAEYHPCISLYNMGSATINLGPHFRYPPADRLFRPSCEMSPSRYPCKEDLIKCWVYFDEVEEETRDGLKVLRKRTIAEVEGLYKRQHNDRVGLGDS